MKGARTRRSGPLASLAGAGTGLFRASLLFGSIAGALMLILLPDAEHRSGIVAENGEGIDRTVTGSIASRPAADAALAGILRRPDAGPCIMFPDGTQRGACR